jgi:CRISPR-associated protein Csb1
MNEKSVTVTEEMINGWISKPDPPVAVRLKQRLLPIEESGIIFPPTYADIGYNIDTLSDGTRVATVDSVGSQANRLEPIFKSDSREPDEWLVPQIQIVIREELCGECEGCKKADGQRVSECKNPLKVTRSLLDLAHRGADAVVRSSPDLQALVEKAFKSLHQGDAGPLCAIAPTSLVFGVWDSRGAGEKRPRLVRSIIRAWDVEPLHAAAQFNSVWKLMDEEQQRELQKEAEAKKKKLSEIGFKDAPATFRKTKARQSLDNGSPNPEARVLGGVLVRGRIEREVTVNLIALRGLGGKNPTETVAIQRYLLGLSLVAATADIELFLREGCLLRYAESGDQWYQVPRRGEPTPVSLEATDVMKYAKNAASVFRPKWREIFKAKWPEGAAKPDLKYQFNLDEAKKLLAKKAAEEESEAE